MRTSAEPLAQTGAIIRAIHEVDPTQGVSAIGLIEQDVEKVLARPRLQAGLVRSSSWRSRRSSFPRGAQLRSTQSPLCIWSERRWERTAALS